MSSSEPRRSPVEPADRDEETLASSPRHKPDVDREHGILEA
jgi:hypothetical protein